MNLRNFRNEARDDYLEAILMITQEKGHCRSINIAEINDNLITHEQAQYLRDKYLWGKDV